MRFPKLPRARTALIVAALIISALVWEAFALVTGEQGAWTFSQLWWAACENELLVFVVGMLFGHLVWQRRRCGHCGLPPHRVTEATLALFNSILIRLGAIYRAEWDVAVGDKGNQPDIEDVKRRAGFRPGGS